MNNVNELTGDTRSGTLTVAGAVSTTPTGVTVQDNANSPVAATVYGDNTFARENVTLLNGTKKVSVNGIDIFLPGDHDAARLESCEWNIRERFTM